MPVRTLSEIHHEGAAMSCDETQIECVVPASGASSNGDKTAEAPRGVLVP